jgi:hypothetical protein
MASNLFVNLPVAAGDGAGAGQDTAGMGKEKTITVQGAGMTGVVNVQISLDGGATWGTIASFTAPGKQILPFAASQMRTLRAGFAGGTLPNVDVAADDDGAVFVQPAVPAADGTGANTDISTHGDWKTLQVTGAFTGVLIVQFSEDGTDWLEFDEFVFTTPSMASRAFTANLMRVVRRGTAATPGLPVVSMGSINDEIVTASMTVSAVFAGPGAVTARLGEITLVNPTGGAVTVNLPAIAAGNRGKFICVKNTTADLTAITIDPSGAQTIDDAATLVMVTAQRSVMIASDGTGNWEVISTT